MTWFADIVCRYPVVTLTISHVGMLVVGFVVAIAYAHGHEQREFKRVARRGRK